MHEGHLDPRAVGSHRDIAVSSAPVRAAVRDALEATKNVAGSHGVFNMSANDHLGLDQRARVMVNIKDGAWQLAR